MIVSALVTTDAENPDTGLLFDLENDPLEKYNVYAETVYQQDRGQLLAAVRDWKEQTTFEEMYVIEEAPQINQPNVPADLRHRESVRQYYRKKMNESL